ncbi:hypothetical protein JCGZ_24665 [Jatropha curcas]|uniref:C3H1-type domain-containing protein n=1 Tax=Jatropha curcas TaxID=180498 RepID=A0A067KWT1_JATCU|nr:zinc finger CCCH domain-containing protein 62 [Jatropha curcas]KDP40666.1 hypothetical protein JCGZ_24665 [Jatropha curcas]
MAFLKQEQLVIEEQEDFSDSGGSDPGYESDMDPSYCILEETQGQLSILSIQKKSKSSIFDMGVEIIDQKEIEQVQEIIEAGKTEKLKVEQCKDYLRKNGLRLTGNKETLIQRIKEHQEILNGGGEKKYPVSSFVFDCKGDACMGDLVMFEQNVYEMYNIASRSASGPPCGTRIVAGRIVKESYGASKRQHTFTIEVLWSKGEKPLPPLHPLLIKGRNLYRFKTLRQRWEDEEERRKVLMEKHSRGSLARCARESRIQEKERRNMLRENRVLTKEEGNRKQSQLKANQGIQAKQSGSSVNLGKAFPKPLRSTQASEAQISGKLALKPELQKNQRVNKNCNHVPYNLVYYHTRIQEVLLQNNDNFGSRLSYLNINDPPFNKNPITTWKSERYHHRQPLTSMNHDHQITVLNRQGYQQQKLCEFYAQGRCMYGGNCKFLHELKVIRGQRRENGRL